jgi:manganese/zinc/iron transport system permease protein
LIAATALGAAIFSMLLFKEFSLLCFDYNYASTQGWPVMRLDLLMMTLVVIVTVIGLQAVGLILVVALLIIPASAARFWTHRLSMMLMISGFFGALSGLFGSAFSALMANLPAGAIIVLVAAMIFLFSLTFGSASGLVRHFFERRQLSKKIARENLLREIFEFYETQHVLNGSETEKTKRSAGIDFAALKIARAWSDRQLRGTIRSAIRAGLVRVDNGAYGLTEGGMSKAYEIVRKHRLWEAYLITHADIAPSQVDWGADAIEHVLDRKMIQELENKLPQLKNVRMPTSPHELAISQAAG